jgi:mannose-6-phosphate isomerase-like protein (cupin superfamily)
MAVDLAGPCRVVDLREGDLQRAGSVRVWNHFGRGHGAEAISLRVMEFVAGATMATVQESHEEILYVLEGTATIAINGRGFPVRPETGVFLPPRTRVTFRVDRSAPLLVLSSRCPDPGSAAAFVPAPLDERDLYEGVDPTAYLWERSSRPTGDRWYRVLIDARQGCRESTQFVGAVPPGRAPDHYHHYEEVLCILQGEGRMWADRANAPLAPGSCVFLPRNQVHCVENTGEGELRLLGVFHPSGSPAVRYDPE